MIKDVQKGIATLGGEKALVKVYTNLLGKKELEVIANWYTVGDIKW